MEATHTLGELEHLKFSVIDGFCVGRLQRGCRNKFIFTLMETVPPAKYGCDPKYYYYNVQLNTEQDFEQLTYFMNDLFDRTDINIPSGKNVIDYMAKLRNQITKRSKVINWGSCHITYMPINSKYQKLYLCKAV